MCAILVLGALIFLPAVRAPLFLDDFLQGAMVEGTFPAHRGPFDLYSFVDDADRASLLERGLLPWWTDPRLTIRFFRPLASGLLFVEHRVFSHAALPMHLHSFAWWAFAVLAVRRLFRRLFAPRTALLATAIFALSPCHSLPLAWIANRETLISLTFGALGLASHATWHSERRLRDGAFAAVLFGLALFGGGEYALSFGGYVLAMEIVRSRDSMARRIVGLLPFVVPALGYLAVRAALKYGTLGSGFYSDPLRDPAAFFANAPLRAVTLLGAAWFTLDDSWRFGLMRWFLIAFVAIGSLAMVFVFRRAVARLEDGPKAAARWLLYGSVISLVPTLAVVPSRRLLGVAMLGVAVTSALIVERAWFPTPEDEAEPKSRRASLASLAALTLAFCHFVHGPGTAWLMARMHNADGTDFASRVAFLREKVGNVPGAEVGLARALAGDFFVPFALDRRGRPPQHWTVLAHANHVLALRRDERTVDLIAPAGRGLYPIGERNLYRGETQRLRAGDVVKVPGLRVTVLESSATMGPRTARFSFDRDPDTFTWVTDDFDEMRIAELPRIGFGQPFDARGANANP